MSFESLGGHFTLSLTDPSHFATTPTTGRNSATAACRMIAIFDYDPRESSPNTDIEVRLAPVYYCLIKYGKDKF